MAPSHEPPSPLVHLAGLAAAGALGLAAWGAYDLAVWLLRLTPLQPAASIGGFVAAVAVLSLGEPGWAWLAPRIGRWTARPPRH